MRILVIGHKGQLGRELLSVMHADEVLGLDLPEFDMTDAAATMRAVCDFRPAVVLLPAALTDVDLCAQEPELALRVNGLGTHNVALACLRCDAALLYVSSNEVFDGRKGKPYYEHDTPNPINPYGASKLAGEVYTRMHLAKFYIVRTAWLYARGGNNFPAKIVAAADKHGKLRVVCDEISSPTYAPDLAQAIDRLIRSEQYGIYHFTNEGACSRLEFARQILRLAGRGDVPLEPITSDQWPRASVPPLNCVIRNLAGAQIGIRLRPWDEALADALYQGAYFG
ncbi:MAG: dTDP-4-dehydrorhamnose reductase [Anaerolineae bacterium]|nr:dTDP-4-dehydrorhamnose reductase [Anaerolineae bacterium]